MLRQRRLLLALGAASLPACAALGRSPARPIEVGDGAFMIAGEPGEAGPGNRGRIGNAGFVVGDDGVVAIDTGTSYRHGLDLLRSIRHVSARPLRAAFMTSVRQEFVFGAAAFREHGVPLHMQRRAAQLMRARCDGCLKTLHELLGADAMRGTRVVEPDVPFDASHVYEAIGRPLRVLHFGTSSGPGDIALFDQRAGVLFAGGLLDARRIPDVQDSDLAGWQRALSELRALPLRAIVPGHGPASDGALIGRVERYLQQLQARLLELLRAGAPLSEVADAAALPEFEDWDQYATIHRRNASIVYLRLERDLLLK